MDGAQASCFTLNTEMEAFQEAHGVAEAGNDEYLLATDACCCDLNDLSHHPQVYCGCGNEYAMHAVHAVHAVHCWNIGTLEHQSCSLCSSCHVASEAYCTT